MKTARFLLSVMIGAVVVLQSSSFARQSHPAPQQAASPSEEKSASDRQLNEQNHGEARAEKEQPVTSNPDGARTSPKRPTNRVSRHRANPSQYKSAARRQLPAKTLTTNSPRTPESVTGPQETSLKAAIAFPNKAVSHHRVSAPPPAASIDGQHFKNSRDPGGRLAISGGSLTAGRGTAAINGTDMKRKP
jgi:hypothetical protein